MQSKIIFNGKEYNSVEDMPTDARQAYESMMGIFADKDQNGIPDIMEGKGEVNAQMIQPSSNVTMQSATIVYDGKAYNNVDELPPEARAQYAQAMGMLADQNQNGVPDMLENVLAMPSAQFTQTMPTSSLAPMPHDPLQTDSGKRANTLLIVGVVIAALLLVVAALLAVVVFSSFAP
jgi:hypothetical protein